MSRVLPARPITLTSAASISGSGVHASGFPTVGAAVEAPRSATDVLFDTLDRNRDGVLTRSEFAATGLGSPVSFTASVQGSSTRIPAAPSVGASAASSRVSSYVPQPVRGASVSLSSGLAQSGGVPALVEARVLQSSSPRPAARQLSGQGSVVAAQPVREARAASPIRAASIAGAAVAAEPVAQAAAAGGGRALNREEMLRTGRLMKSSAEMPVGGLVKQEAPQPVQPTAAAAPMAARTLSSSSGLAVHQASEPTVVRSAASGAGRPEGPEFAPRWAQVISTKPTPQAPPAEPVVRAAEPVVAPLPSAAAAVPQARPQAQGGAVIQLEGMQRQAQQATASGVLSPQSVGSASIAMSLAAQAAAPPVLEGVATGPRTGTATPILTSAAETRLREELEEMRSAATSEASSASQLRLQLRTAEAAVRAANLQAQSAAAQARAEVQASAAPVSRGDSDKLAAELRESSSMNSQLKVELACMTQMRDNVQLDLQEEVHSANALRTQLQEAEAAAWQLGQTSGCTEVEDLRNRNAELEAEAARHLRVCDRIYEDYAGQTELNSQLKHELAVAQELAEANMDYPANDFDDGERSRQQMRIMELEAERMQQQSRIIELEALAESAAARQRELEQALEEERARTAQLQGQLDAQALQQQSSEQAVAAGDLNAAAVETRLMKELPMAQRRRARQERLLKSLEAEQAKVSRLREALVAAEERAQSAEQARQEAEGVAAAAQAASPPPTSPARDSGAAVSLRDLAWEHVGGAEGDAVPESGRLSRQLSAASKDRLFEAATSDDVEALKAALQGEEDAVHAVLRARDDRGRTLLQVSLANGSDEAAKFFLGEGQRWAQRRKFMFQLQGELLERELGRFVNGQDHFGQNALAVLCGTTSASREVFGALMEAQADPTQRDMAGKTPFIECAKSGNLQVMGALLRASRGVVLADADDANRSPLHWAAQEGQREAVTLLLKAGADADAADVEGNTAADLARGAGHMEVAQVLAEAMSDDTLGEFLAQDGAGGPGPSGMDGFGEEDGEDFEIPQEDSVHGRVPRGFEDDDDDFLTGHGPGGGSQRWTSL